MEKERQVTSQELSWEDMMETLGLSDPQGCY